MTLHHIEKRILKIDELLVDKNREKQIVTALITEIQEGQLKCESVFEVLIVDRGRRV